MLFRKTVKSEEKPWRKRRRKLLERLEYPCTIAQVEDLFACGEETPKRAKSRYKRAQRALNKLVKRPSVYRIGMVETGGRPAYVYCRRRIKLDNLEHEVKLTEFLLYFTMPIDRLGDVDPKLRPDATMHAKGGDYHVEMDEGTHSAFKAAKRLEVYQNVQATVLFITTSIARGKNILKRCQFLGDKLWVSLYEKAVADPAGKVWVTPTGKAMALPVG